MRNTNCHHWFYFTSFIVYFVLFRLGTVVSVFELRVMRLRDKFMEKCFDKAPVA